MSKHELNFVGVGDLHLDSKLGKYIPDINRVIMDEVRSGPVRYAVRHGIPLVVFYGDICDVPSMSTNATIELCRLFYDYPSLRFVLILGNHDVEYEGKHSLILLKELVDKKALPNVKVIEEPTVLFGDSGTPLRLLPWPHFSVQKDALNVIHLEVNGSQWDHGKSVESERNTSAYCVSGHLHTKQVVGPKKNIHYSGTLYQTSFGEKPDKYFHSVSWVPGEKPRVRLVPHKPKYQLHNLIISSKEDLSKISDASTDLYKVFVKSGSDLDSSTLGRYPNVVKVNSFKSREELKNLLAEDLILQDTSEEVNMMSILDALKSYMVRAGMQTEDRERTLKVLKSITGNKIK